MNHIEKNNCNNTFFGKKEINMDAKKIENAYNLAKERYISIGIDTEKVISELSKIPISLQCWQGDDVGGFEQPNKALSGGGIQATGNYLGKPRNLDEFRADVDKALSLIPGKHRLNLHASYLENKGAFLDRNEIGPEHFEGWVEWAKERKMGLDFNPTYFSHPKASDGFTLSHKDNGIRQFWIEHGIACRTIGEYMGKELGTPTIVNFWIPDGFKDIPVDRLQPRERLADSLDKIFTKELDARFIKDSVEPKLFGIGAESYTAGSHEFYIGYTISRKKLITIDSGHYHPTEGIADKISSVVMFVPEILLHISRPVRWDSDHVVILNDDLLGTAQEIIRCQRIGKINIGLDFFDASINRIAAWVIGSRSTIKALLMAMLEPLEQLQNFELNGDYTSRLAMLEELKTMPFAAVWDYYCMKNNVPVGSQWLNIVKEYEQKVLINRK